MALGVILARKLESEEIPDRIRSAFPTDKKVRLSEWAGDCHVLVHDGKHIISLHGKGCSTGCGNPDYTMVCGSEKEVQAEISRLGITWPSPAEGSAESVEVEAEVERVG